MIRTLKISALALIGVMVLWACGGGPNKDLDAGAAASTFLKAIKAGDFSAAQGQATKETSEGIDKIKDNALSASAVKGDPNDIVIGEVNEEGDYATVSYTDAGSEKTIKMKKVDGAWLAVWSKNALDSGTESLGKGLEDMGGALKEATEGLQKTLENIEVE